MAAPAAPAAGAGVEAIAGLFLILAYVVLIAVHRAWISTLGWLMHKIADLIDFGIAIPLKGTVHPLRSAANAIRAASDNVATAIGSLALRSENGAVWMFHQSEATLRWVGAEIASLAEDTWHGIDEVITRDIPALITLGTHKLDRAFRGIEAGVTSLEHKLAHEFKGIDAFVRTLEQKIAHDIAHAGTVASHLYGITAKQLRRLGRRTSALEKATIGAGAAALTAAALSKLGLRWLKCPALGRIGRKIGCGGFHWLETFFAEAFEALLVLDLCRFALGAQKLARLVVPQLGAVLLVQDAVCLGGGATLPSAHDSPTVSLVITLPSAHD